MTENVKTERYTRSVSYQSYISNNSALLIRIERNSKEIIHVHL